MVRLLAQALQPQAEPTLLSPIRGCHRQKLLVLQPPTAAATAACPHDWQYSPIAMAAELACACAFCSHSVHRRLCCRCQARFT